MTGRILRLWTANAAGAIAVENGLRLGFRPSAMLEYDIKDLAVGQYVSCDLAEGHPPTATNVVVWKRRRESAKRHGEERTTLRYEGFVQADGMRSYRFDRVVAGEDTLPFHVAANQALLTLYRVPLQEGPALCHRVLTSELRTRERSDWPLLRCSLTERDMLEYLARRAVRGLHPQPYRRHPAQPGKI